MLSLFFCLSSSSLSPFQLSSNTTLFFSYSYSYAFHLLHFTTLYPSLWHTLFLLHVSNGFMWVFLPSILSFSLHWLDYKLILLLQKGRKFFFQILFCMCFAISETVWLMWYQNCCMFFIIFFFGEWKCDVSMFTTGYESEFEIIFGLSNMVIAGLMILYLLCTEYLLTVSSNFR